MKYVYLIQSQEDGYYKFGISIHPNKRVKEHQTGNPSELKLIHTYLSEHARKIETTLKNRYSYLKKEGEWFDLSLKGEIAFLTDCKQIEETINILKIKGNVFI